MNQERMVVRGILYDLTDNGLNGYVAWRSRGTPSHYLWRFRKRWGVEIPDGLYSSKMRWAGTPEEAVDIYLDVAVCRIAKMLKEEAKTLSRFSGGLRVGDLLEALRERLDP